MNKLDVKKMRKKLGITQSELAELLGVSRGTIVNYERGEVIPESKRALLHKINSSEQNYSKNYSANEEKSSYALTKAPGGRLPKRRTSNMAPVAYYDVDFIAGDIETFENDSIQPAYYMDIPEFSGCTAFRIYNDSMEKLIKSGSIVFGTKIESWMDHLEYGQIYGIISNDGRRYLKYIRKYEKDDQNYFLLRSENSDYDDFTMPLANIRSIWLIHGWLNKRV